MKSLDLVPKKVFLTKGIGYHKNKLAAFEEALRDAGIANQNLVMVSSIFPPHCKIISKRQGLKYMEPGSIRFCVMARSENNEHGRLAYSSIGIAIPKDDNQWGYLSEVHGYGKNNKMAGEEAEDLAATMLGTTIGIEVDPETAWSEREQQYKSSGLIIKTTEITQTGIGKDGLWCSCIAAAVLIL